MLIAYRRHRKSCRHFRRKNNRRLRGCSCPVWVQGTLAKEPIRESLNTTSWQFAQNTIREWEAAGSRIGSERKTLEDAWKDFMADREKTVNASTLRKYKLLQRQTEAFAQDKGIRFVNQLDLPAATQFRTGWKDGQRTSVKKLERLRTFFRFCQDRKWIDENPAARLKAPRISLSPTLPFSKHEMQAILKATEQYAKEVPAMGRDNALRLKALVLLLRYSGLRLGDAVGLSTDRIVGNRLFLYTQKTGEPVNTLLPESALNELKAIPHAGHKHYFWSGQGKLDSVVRSWQTRLHRLFQIAKIPNGHAHRFRDTFAVELLLANPPVPIEQVSILLGHSSVEITERHYAPWNQARQAQLEKSLQNAWKSDPLAQTGGYISGTRAIR